MTATTSPHTRNAPPASHRVIRRRRPLPRANPKVTLWIVYSGAAAGIALWWQDTSGIRGLGDWLTGAGRVTGLLAGYGVIVLVALMARLPPLERGVGADRLARWHARGGRYVVSLIVAHALLITWGYAVTGHTDVVTQAEVLVLSYPDVLMASVAGLLFVGIAAVSVRAARRRMRYETWYYLHFYTYLATALAFSHQFATGADFVGSLPARIGWSSLYVAVATAILWYRFVLPVRQAFRHRMRVQSVQSEGPGVVSITVTGRHLDELNAESGQFFRWRFLTSGMWWTTNPYSLSAPPTNNQLRFTAKTFGDHSAALATVRPGTRVMTEGPYGALTAGRRRQRKVLLVAGGIGVTPLRALLQTLHGEPGDMTMLYRVRDEHDLVLRDELTEVARARGARLHFLIGSRRLLGADPLSATALRANVPDLAEHDVYLCGPEAMMRALVTSLHDAGVPRRQIHHESFAF